MNSRKCLAMFFKLSWRLCPSYVVVLFLNTLVSSGQILMNIVLPKYLIDELTGGRSADRLLLFGAAIVLANLLFAFLTNTINRLLEEKKVFMREKINEAMSEKIMNVEFSYLENPYYLDLKERAVFAINNQGALQNLINTMAGALKNAATLIGLLAIMLTLSPIFVLILIATIVIMLLIQKSFLDYQVKFSGEILPVNRKYGYYVNLAFENKYQKDIRLYSMSKMLTDRVTTYNKEINTWFTAFYRKMGVAMGLYSIVNDLQAALAYGYVGIRVISDVLGKRITIGSFTMYVSSAVSFSKTVLELGQNYMTVFQMLQYLNPFMEFMSLPNEQEEGSVPFEGEIEELSFENVSFCYPGSDKKVLEDISFKVQKGEKISIVGLNGAGKTTLVKLICRFYHPTEGCIKVNGRDIFEYNHTTYMKQLSAVFQDFKLFAFSIEENITGEDSGSNIEAVEDIIEQVGLKEKVDSLPKGISSMFGKDYDKEGIEMSGGQGQKLAIARALYKGGSLIILDEPTSALDPLAEAEIYEKFNELIGEKTALYISHRMSSSIFCDKILVINGGRIEDFDSHNNLMKKTESTYYKLFSSQAVNYQL